MPVQRQHDEQAADRAWTASSQPPSPPVDIACAVVVGVGAGTRSRQFLVMARRRRFQANWLSPGRPVSARRANGGRSGYPPLEHRTTEQKQDGQRNTHHDKISHRPPDGPGLVRQVGSPSSEESDRVPRRRCEHLVIGPIRREKFSAAAMGGRKTKADLHPWALQRIEQSLVVGFSFRYSC